MRPSMPTGCTFPLRACTRSFTNVRVLATTRAMGPLIHIAVSIECASKSPVTPDPASLISSRQVASPPWGTFSEIVPVLQVRGPVVEGLADATLVHDLLRKRDGRYPAVVEPDHVRYTSLVNRLNHRVRLRDAHSQRLLAADHLSRFGRCHGDVLVHVVGGADVD